MSAGPVRGEPDDLLVLGPMLRYVGLTEATIWVQAAHPVVVTVEADGREWAAVSFAVHDHHYALVILDGLSPGAELEYTVSIGGQVVWPPAGSPYPAPRIRTLDLDRPTRLVFGSCRVSESHDRKSNRQNGIDALHALALALADEPGAGDAQWPDLVAFLGDQVYADETSEAMREFIAHRRGLEDPPGTEIKDFVEYAHLYHLAWSDPANRWLLSTVPSCMIFDDHDIRDDWNTSWTWHEQINRSPWWHERLVGGLSSYWVYQHLGNLSPAQLARDPIHQRVLASREHLDLTSAVRDLATRVDRHPWVYRWSYSRDLGDCRLVVVDSRAARVLEPGHRSMLDPDELAWLDEQLSGAVDHLLIGTSLPFLLPPGLHDLEAIDEAVASGRYGSGPARLAERIRQKIDLEHWAAFADDMAEVFEMVMDLARGNRGRAPYTIVFLSGDVHNSYLAEVTDALARHGARSRIVQAVCSPIRNPMPKAMRVVMSAFAKSLAHPMRAVAGRSKHMPDPAYPWRVTHGPWFENCFAELAVDGADLTITWRGGEAGGEGDDEPEQSTRMVRVAQVPVRGTPA
ncbi:MAG: alkaline phosphatase family protein [Intrasporangium sp.]|uniref:alkaline phosphatase D family protein n=1 Tax=Intrasporangium sp. TaxID=1925024 RepID=UPI00264980AF|nr:alkaline phosphatase D family protein [Intrasporangium sp.]MDN5797634.1 alkaline phosphatase family protein [Intrasporangium sp.]